MPIYFAVVLDGLLSLINQTSYSFTYNITAWVSIKYFNTYSQHHCHVCKKSIQNLQSAFFYICLDRNILKFHLLQLVDVSQVTFNHQVSPASLFSSLSKFCKRNQVTWPVELPTVPYSQLTQISYWNSSQKNVKIQEYTREPKSPMTIRIETLLISN